jgi:hypothetical protein
MKKKAPIQLYKLDLRMEGEDVPMLDPVTREKIIITKTETDFVKFWIYPSSRRSYKLVTDKELDKLSSNLRIELSNKLEQQRLANMSPAQIEVEKLRKELKADADRENKKLKAEIAKMRTEKKG